MGQKNRSFEKSAPPGARIAQRHGKEQGQREQEHAAADHDDQIVGKRHVDPLIAQGFFEIVQAHKGGVFEAETAPAIKADAKGIEGGIEQKNAVE